ncbi:hypothetical protein NFI96_018836 [Prochilodus magdalenae]|nr:hypothetical protein NFI96_018836 [Prochilodus magdalenae]
MEAYGAVITQSENTLYAVVQATGAATPPIALETPTTVYSTVQTPQPTSNGQLSETAPDAGNEQQPTSEPNSANTYDTVPNQSQSVKPETIYAIVTKPSKPVTQDTSDGTA